jgi:pilus assembly protein CpaE
VAYTISEDEAVMRAALDRGVPISDIKRKSAVGRDIDALDNGVAAALGLER